jgi:flagellar assembly protein FliH
VLKKYEDIGKRIIEDAQKEKEAIVLKAQLSADKAEKEAYEKGYNQGIQNGYDDGYKKAYEETVEKATIEAKEIVEKAEKLLNSARENYSEYLECKKTEVIKLALEIASNITKQKLSKEDSMNTLIEDAFKLSKGEESTILKANSFYYEELKNMVSKWKVEYSIKNDIFVLADDNIEKGNAILEKPSGIVKVGIDIGMEQIRKALLG